MWTYKGVDVDRHGPNSMGLRWIARNPNPNGRTLYLRADTKDGMRELITDALAGRI